VRRELHFGEKGTGQDTWLYESIGIKLADIEEGHQRRPCKNGWPYATKKQKSQTELRKSTMMRSTQYGRNSEVEMRANGRKKTGLTKRCHEKEVYRELDLNTKRSSKRVDGGGEGASMRGPDGGEVRGLNLRICSIILEQSEKADKNSTVKAWPGDVIQIGRMAAPCRQSRGGL